TSSNATVSSLFLLYTFDTFLSSITHLPPITYNSYKNNIHCTKKESKCNNFLDLSILYRYINKRNADIRSIYVSLTLYVYILHLINFIIYNLCFKTNIITTKYHSNPVIALFSPSCIQYIFGKIL